MYIISMERSGGGVAAGKRNQERSYHYCPHSQQRTSGVVTKEEGGVTAWPLVGLDFGPHSFI